VDDHGGDGDESMADETFKDFVEEISVNREEVQETCVTREDVVNNVFGKNDS
jgi:hypothetical protein